MMSKEKCALYLLDANIIINAHELYYPLKRVPEFWEWILFHASNGKIKLPDEIISEIQGGESAQHACWVHDKTNKSTLLLNETFDLELLQMVVNEGYAPDLNELEIEQIGQDPFLIAYAMKDKENRVVVTNETSAPSKTRSKKKVPDVCDLLGIKHCNVYTLIRELEFSTNWLQNSI